MHRREFLRKAIGLAVIAGAVAAVASPAEALPSLVAPLTPPNDETAGRTDDQNRAESEGEFIQVRRGGGHGRGRGHGRHRGWGFGRRGWGRRRRVRWGWRRRRRHLGWYRRRRRWGWRRRRWRRRFWY
jgi:hypothetical protein